MISFESTCTQFQCIGRYSYKYFGSSVLGTLIDGYVTINWYFNPVLALCITAGFFMIVHTVETKM